MACHGVEAGGHPQHQHLETAFSAAQSWIEAVTGRRFADKDFCGSLGNGILLCELLNAIKPGLVKKINRLPTPIAGLDNLAVFLRGCEEFGLKGSQLFDAGDLQDSTHTHVRDSDCSKKLKNVLITIYWLGRAANSFTSYSGPTLDLKEFEGLLSQMRKEAEDTDSSTRSVRDSGYIDCWDSERSDSLSPPRHGRDDSFDSLDSFGSRSQQTPSPDVVFRGSSDGRGSDSEGDVPQRKQPDMRRDDMLARRLSCTELRTVMPFNQYLPNKSNQGGYVLSGAPHRRPKADECRRSWSTATSPVTAERPFRYSQRSSVSDDPESMSLMDMRCDEDVFLQPHSQARHEYLHNQYNQLREEDTHWQTDLARWKSRRRSISQDLIKKEKERKTMEKLMSGDNDLAQRRKSFKTYKEIVEEKERRERELHEMYRNARTPEEAEAVLQCYAQRFSISEAVLTQLRLPRPLERSMSAEPASSAHEPGPMRYLRQQSLPAPRFTSTVEAIVAKVPPIQAQENSPTQTPPQRTVSSQASRPAALRSIQVDQMAQLDGDPGQEFSSSVDGGGQREASPPAVFESTAQVPFSPRREPQLVTTVLELRQQDDGPQNAPSRPEGHGAEAPSQETRLTRPTTLPTKLQSVDSDQIADGASEPLQANAEGNSQHTEDQPAEEASNSGVKAASPEKKCIATATLHMECSPARQTHSADAGGTVESQTENAELIPAQGTKDDQLFPHTQSYIPPVKTDWTFGNPAPEPMERVQSHVVYLPPLNLTGRVVRWVWDPEEERKRQERWQREQERLLQERYRLQQEKLRRDWERAQREVEEEESRYHEEERKILEETVVPLMPGSSAVTSPRPGGPALPIVRSLADWERKQELLERQRGEDHENLLTNEKSDVVTEQKMQMESCTKPGSSWVSCSSRPAAIGQVQQNGQSQPRDLGPPGTTEMLVPRGSVCDSQKQEMKEPWSKRTSLEHSWSCQQSLATGIKRADSYQEVETNYSSSWTSDVQSPVANRSVSGKKLCSSCKQPLGRGAAMIIDTLSLCFHIGCFKCGMCKGQLGDTSTGTDVRIRNGLLTCQQCYVGSRVAGQPTTL
ncbi:LIM and calponin homology domains-containing protein 1-like isoform X2 [Brienomyrus brachyistius]|uniref:LIM and calponin homology domains-containing protein 1-like isoform X2 n=1 Tax=Brienomyrus brachyistius TaxID=42636 RepID=UPI0020B286EE|nr:LIM and calponin homology domains-containing protein 1-like isoform X2 [Brienomyrus brachyistius]